MDDVFLELARDTAEFSELVSTPARPTSEPVPAVVGTATLGWIASQSARFHQSPMSSKSQTGRVWSAMKATSLPRSRPEPPPKATTPSCPPALNASIPALRSCSFGFARTSANSARPSLPASSRSSARCVIGLSFRPLSVTSSGFSIPAARQASASSWMRPAPKRMLAG